MSSVYGRNIRYSLFGESHGPALGIVVDNLPSGYHLDLSAIQFQLDRRKPGKNDISSARQEEDKFEILSGLKDGVTTGAPLCAVIRNVDQRSADYGETLSAFRPSHADYTGYIKYQGFQDHRGGGPFSGRMTAALVLGGAVARQILHGQGIHIYSHVLKSGLVEDESFEAYVARTGDTELRYIHTLLGTSVGLEVPMLCEKQRSALLRQIAEVKTAGDSIGGTIETAAVGLPVGLGDPYFESMESEISRLLFSIPGVKGVSFGAGFGFSAMKGSVANDPLHMVAGRVRTSSNHSGGINGGISNGMPLVAQAVFRPTPSIAKEQQTISPLGEEVTLRIKGRHDPCIFIRGLPVVEGAMAMALLDKLKNTI